MKSLVFIILRSAKNNLLELRKKPAKLLMYIFVIALIIFLLLMPAFTQQTSDREFADLVWLEGITFLFILFFLVISIQKGLTSGDSIFEMNDVNLLFVSPVSPKAILLYGLVRMTKIAFISGIFILFQGNSLGMGFGVNFGGLLVLLAAFMLSMIFLSVLSILIYSITNGNRKRKRIVRLLTVLAFVPLAVYALMLYMNSGDLMTALALTIHSPFLSWIPAAGWGAAGAIAILDGDVTVGLGYFALIVGASALLTVYIAVSKSDYYEDVLVATETAFEKKRAVQEGNINTIAAQSNKKVKVVKTGIGGVGGSTLFRKHLRESFRENRFGFLNLTSVIIFLSAGAAAFFLPDLGGCVMILQVLMWIQVFMIGTGRGLKELYVHYIYLIPEPSFTKIVWSNLELVFKTLLESILFFGLAGAILRDNVFVILGAILVYSLFALLLIGINVLFVRWTSANISAGILLVVYMIAVVVVMLPGLIPALMVGYSLGGVGGTVAGLGILTAWELVAALVCFALAKGVLHNCDMPVMKQGK